MEAAYEARTDKGRTYACYACAVPVEEAKIQLKIARKARELASLQLHFRRDKVAQYCILVLDAIRAERETEKMYNTFNMIHLLMMKAATVLTMLNERYTEALKQVQIATTHRICCLHRSEDSAGFGDINMTWLLIFRSPLRVSARPTRSPARYGS